MKLVHQQYRSFVCANPPSSPNIIWKLVFLYFHNMIYRSIILLFFIPHWVFGQNLIEPRQKAINNYIHLINHLSDEVKSLGPSLVRFHTEKKTYRKNSSRPLPEYICGLDAKPYYFEEAKKTSQNLGTSGSSLIAKVESARTVFQKINEACLSLEVYFRLKDFESDQFKKLDELTSSLENLIQDYSTKVMDVQLEAEKLYYMWQPYNSNLPYHNADKLMRAHLVFEKVLLDSWTFNVADWVHTGWPSEKAQQHILEGSKKIALLNQSGNTLKYPASSMYKSFIESAESLQETKKSGVDGYTFEKQQSDKHSNDLYYGIINYYNNAEISFYNNFIGQASADGFRGIFYLNFVPLFQVRTSVREIKIEVTPFVDKPALEISVPLNASPIPPQVFTSLSNYVDFINEGMRQLDNMMSSIRNLNSSASHGKARMKTGNRVNIDYYYKDFELPVTLFQQTLEQSKSLPKNFQKPLNDQAESLNSILVELNQWNNVLLANAASKQLTKDSLDFVYSIVDRYKLLSETFDDKKERLYKNLRAIFESYKIATPKNPWIVSGKEMLLLLDEDRDQLFRSKKFLKGDSSSRIYTEEIEKMIRDLITNEFTNLAGLQKLGRSNGNCPYSPYEDIASHSKTFAELLLKSKNGTLKSSAFRHPYSQLSHHYNQTLVYDYNKFAELSKVPLLKQVTQLDWFEIIPPEKPQPKKPVEPTPTPSEVVEYVVENPQPQNPQPTKEEKKVDPPAARKKKRDEVGKSQQPTSGVVHDTVRITDIIRIETVRQDTVYISKVDTVYMGMPGDGLTMDGYATNNMVLLLDVSGSMDSPEKLPLLKKSILLLLKIMRAEDEVAIVTYSGKAKIELPSTSFKEENKIKKVIERLKSEGQTDANAGIIMAYNVADKNYIRGGNNRIILATDGEFQIGSKTSQLVSQFAGQDIFLTVFNFGKSASKNLQQLASDGKGNYEFITQQNVDAKLIREVKAKKRK
jgi:Ca-activated chloride channel homolog